MCIIKEYPTDRLSRETKKQTTATVVLWSTCKISAQNSTVSYRVVSYRVANPVKPKIGRFCGPKIDEIVDDVGSILALLYHLIVL